MGKLDAHNPINYIKDSWQLSRDIYISETDSIWWYNHFKHISTDKYDKNGKSLYFRFVDDNKKSYNYIILIT